jgi:hypothetical protein
MGTRIDNISVDQLEEIVDNAHEICDEMLLFAAISMREDEIRSFLTSHKITDNTVQNRYLLLVEKYDKATGCECVVN